MPGISSGNRRDFADGILDPFTAGTGANPYRILDRVTAGDACVISASAP